MKRETKATVCSAVHLLAAAGVYWHLSTGGWLTNSYRLDDSNIVNLLLAIFEAVVILVVAAYCIMRRAALYRAIVVLCFVQLLFGVIFAVLLVILLFAWHPRLM